MISCSPIKKKKKKKKKNLKNYNKHMLLHSCTSTITFDVIHIHIYLMKTIHTICIEHFCFYSFNKYIFLVIQTFLHLTFSMQNLNL